MTAHASAATLGGFLAILLWSTTVALSRSLSERLGPLTAAATVHLIAGLLGLSHLAWRREGMTRWRGFSTRYLVGCGGLFALYSALLYGALGLARDRDDVLAVGLLNYLWPALTILLSIPLLGTRANGWLLPGTLLALAGIAGVCGPVLVTAGTDGPVAAWTRSPWACGMGATAALVWALYSNLARRWGRGQAGGAVEVFMLGTGLLLLAGRTLHPETTSWSVCAMAEALALGSMTAVAYSLWDRAMRDGHFAKVAAASYITPLLSTLVSALYLGVVPGQQVWIGAVLLVSGSILSAWSTSGHGAPQE